MTGHPNSHTPDTPAPRVSGTTANLLGAAFYTCVAAVAFAGQVSAATRWLGWPLLPAALAVAVLELGGIALAARADFRRRLNETAVASRALSAAVAVFAVAFNWIGHAHTGGRLAGAFFAGMSALGYGVWLINAGDRRRDQLRADKMLPPPPPSYDGWQWLTRPLVTWRARAMAKADPALGTYGSLGAAEQAIRTERRRRAIRADLHRKLRDGTLDAADPKVSADIAVHTYDLDEIADRLAASADYDGLTALIADGLSPARLLAGPTRAADTVTAAPTDSVRNVVPITRPAAHRTRRAQPTSRRRPDTGADMTVEELADALTARFGHNQVGKPTAQAHLREVFGSCSGDRAIAAKNLHNARTAAGGGQVEAGASA